MSPPVGAARSGVVGAQTGDAIPDSVVSRPDDNTQFSLQSTTFGLRITTDDTWPEIGGRLSQNISGAMRAYVYRVSDDALMGDVDISGLSAGDAFTIDLDEDLSPFDGSDDTRYYFVADAEGSDYNPGVNNSVTYPYESADGNLSIIAGAQEGSSYGNAVNIVEVGNVGFD